MEMKIEPLECFQEDIDFINQENTIIESTEVKTSEISVLENPRLKHNLIFKIEKEFQKVPSENDNSEYCFLKFQNSEDCADINYHEVKSECNVSATDLNLIKQEDTKLKCTLPKDEFSNGLLTDYCDLPTLKADVDYLEESCSGQQYQDMEQFKHDVSFKEIGKKSYPIPQKRKLEKYLWNRWLACEFCGHFYTDSFGYFTHYLNHIVKIGMCLLNSKTRKPPVKNYTHRYTQRKLYMLTKETKQLKRKSFLHSITDPNKFSFKSKICQKQFLLKQCLFRHLKIYSGEKPFNGKICSKQFSQKQNLNRHLQINASEKSFKCGMCSKIFTKKKYLHKHLRVHTVERPHKCEVCSKQFKQKTDLNRHLKIHTGEKPFTCKICLKHFSQKSNLNQHLNIHTGEISFKCKVCSKRFRKKADLNKHIQIHTGEEPFECEICSKLFTKKKYLKEHLRIHTGEKPFKCEVCSKQFRLNTDLKKHLRIHTGEKPYNCKICSKKFSQKQNLKRHFKIHTGEKSFKCEICLKLFTKKDHFNDHLRIHTDEKSP